MGLVLGDWASVVGHVFLGSKGLGCLQWCSLELMVWSDDEEKWCWQFPQNSPSQLISMSNFTGSLIIGVS